MERGGESSGEQSVNEVGVTSPEALPLESIRPEVADLSMCHAQATAIDLETASQGVVRN